MTRPLFAAVLLVLAVRIGVLLAPGALVADPDGYRAVAENVRDCGTFGRGDVPTAYRPPLYPLMLVPLVALGENSRWAIAALHLAMGLATVGLTYDLGRRLGLGNASVLAALLVGLDPILLAQSAQVMTETLATLLAVAALVLLARLVQRPTVARAAAAGVVFGLAPLCRPTFLPWVALVGLALVAASLLVRLGRRRSPESTATPDRASSPPPLRPLTAAVFLAAVAAVLAPWAIRNYLQFGRPIGTTTHGGYTLLLANNPGFYEFLRSGQWEEVWNADEFNREFFAQTPETTPTAELARDRLAYDWARQSIEHDPGTFAYSCLVRVGRLWNPLPHRVTVNESTARCTMRRAVGLWYVAEYVLAAIGLAAGVRRFRRSGRVAATCVAAAGFLVLTFTAAHTFYWTDMRMRAPLMPLVALAAAWGATRLVRRPDTSNRCHPNVDAASRRVIRPGA
jgi:hypothetical protein